VERRRDRTINELGLVTVDGAHWQLAIACSSGAVSSGKVVDYETEDVTTGNAFKRRLDTLNVGDSITV
jgi:hypothetical protein